jgi:beta-glucosidase
MRGDDPKYLRVLSGLKHFCCNNHEENRNLDSANINPRLLREYYYAAFEPAIREGAAHSVMTAYNELAGVPAMINNDVTRVCKKEWGMLFAVTDGGDFSQNVNVHKYSESHAETIALAFKAGINIMTDTDVTSLAAARAAAESGLVSVETLDAAISEVLTGRFMLGEFDPPDACPYNDTPKELLDCEEFRQVNSRAAHECITLLKNDGVLPMKNLDKIKVAVVGPLANAHYKDWYTGISSCHVTILQALKRDLPGRVMYHDGCDMVAVKSRLTGKYLRVGDNGAVFADSDGITPECLFKKVDWDNGIIYISASLGGSSGKLLRLEEADRGSIANAPVGYVNAIGKDTFEWFGRMVISRHDAGITPGDVIFRTWRHNDIAIDANNRLCEVAGRGITPAKLFEEVIVSDGAAESAKLAAKADYVIVCAGNDPMVPARECFDRKSLELPKAQQKLIKAVTEVNGSCVLTITASYPYTLNQDVPAIIYTAHGGPESGNAVANVLQGYYNPAGRTPQTWYRSEQDLPDIGDYDIAASGMTYLYFEGTPLFSFGHGLSYSTFEYKKLEVTSRNGKIRALINIKNTSDVIGEEVVQLYFTPLNPRVKRPRKQLCRFTRIRIKPGEEHILDMLFDIDCLRFWDVTQGRFVVESGMYRFHIGASSEDIRETVDVEVTGEVIPPRSFAKATPAINCDNKREVFLRYAPKCERHYIHAPMWAGALDYYDTDTEGVSGIEVTASIDVNEGKIGVVYGDNLIGEVIIPAAACPTEFKKYRCRFVKPLKGKDTLTLKPSQYVNLLDIKLI